MARFNLSENRLNVLLQNWVSTLGDVFKQGSPAADQVARWVSSGIVTGNTNFTADTDGNIVAAGTVNTRDMAADGTKLDGITAGAGIGDVIAYGSPDPGTVAVWHDQVGPPPSDGINGTANLTYNLATLTISNDDDSVVKIIGNNDSGNSGAHPQLIFVQKTNNDHAALALDTTGALNIDCNIGTTPAATAPAIIFSTGNVSGDHYYNATARGAITGEGYYGLGTTAPTEQLHVVGNALVTGSITAGSFEATTTYTVATLPAAPTNVLMVKVTDGDAALAWGATVVNSGAGATTYLAWYNGANWTVIGS